MSKVAKLLATDDADYYKGGNGKSFKKPSSWGSTSIEILPFLKGLPFNNLIIAYVQGMHPSNIRVTHGTICCDSMNDRITIYLTEDNKVDRIDQEITVGYSTGFTVDGVLRALKNNTDPYIYEETPTMFLDASILKCEF